MPEALLLFVLERERSREINHLPNMNVCWPETAEHQVSVHFEAEGFGCRRAEILLGPVFKLGKIFIQLLLHLFLCDTQTVPEDTQKNKDCTSNCK